MLSRRVKRTHDLVGVGNYDYDEFVTSDSKRVWSPEDEERRVNRQTWLDSKQETLRDQSKRSKRKLISYYSKWASIPRDVGFLILDKLSEPIDHLRVAAVCKEWRPLAQEYNRLTQRWNTIVPNFMILRKSGAKLVGELYSVPEDKIYNNIQLPISSDQDLDNPNPLWTWCSCGHGWLAKVERDPDRRQFHITLFNPFRNPVETLLLPPMIEHGRPSRMVSMRVILSANPTSNQDNYVVIAYYYPCSRIFFFKGGRWTCTKEEMCIATEAMLHKGQVYLVHDSAMKPETFLTIFDVDSSCFEPSNPRRVLKIRSTRRPLDYGWGCLVASTQGHLFRLGINRQTYELVFNEKEDNVQEVYVKSIGDEAFFVGCHSPISISASTFSGCQPNFKYYNDGLEMGICKLEPGSEIKMPYLPWQEHVIRTLWITPPFNGLC